MVYFSCHYRSRLHSFITIIKDAKATWPIMWRNNYERCLWDVALLSWLCFSSPAFYKAFGLFVFMVLNVADY